LFQEFPPSDAKLLSQAEHIPYQPGLNADNAESSVKIKSKCDQEKHPTTEKGHNIKERSQTSLQRRSLISESHPSQRSSLISMHSSNAKLDSHEISDLSPTTSFVQSKKGRHSSLLASVELGSSVSMGSLTLQDNEVCKVMGNQV
jgi:hypothetical protein